MTPPDALPTGELHRQPWRSAVEDGPWDRSPVLRDDEREAIVVLKSRRFRLGHRFAERNLAQHEVLERLRGPLQAATELTSCRPESGPVAVFVMLDECARAGTTFRAWDADPWVAVLGEHSRAFTARHEAAIAQDVRLVLAAVGLLLNCFRGVDVLRRLGRFRRRSLADKVFGTMAMAAVAEDIAALLRRWGYVVRGPLLNAL